MSLCLDTSCLLKLLIAEPESEKVHVLVHGEPRVVISTLAELEAEQQLRSQFLGGTLSRRAYNRVSGFLADLRRTPPFLHLIAPHDLAQIARDQIERSTAYCRTLDRLHLAAMETLGVQRLLTNDDSQAAAARELGFGVVLPR